MLPTLLEKLGMDGLMFMFSLTSLLGLIFVLRVVPETKGKTFDEIMKMLEQ